MMSVRVVKYATGAVAAVCLFYFSGCQHPESSVSPPAETPESAPVTVAPEPSFEPGVRDADPNIVPVAASDSSAAPGPEPLARERSLLVLELFTSEGCSSCPPADRNLQTIHAGREQLDDEVVVLSWHVDYWNYLGWKDPFSFREASQRQRRYAARLKTGVFTPQLIVNGAQSAVGSRSAEVARAINRGRLAPAALISVSTGLERGGTCRVVVEYDNVPMGGVVLIGLAQKSAVVNVSVGENGGRKLEHVNVVRNFQQKRATSTKGRVATVLQLPEGLTSGAANIFVLLQTTGAGEVLDAALLPLKPLT